MCAWRFKISVARRQHSNFGDEAGLTIQASLSHFSLSARTESKQEAAQVGGLRKVTMACLLAPALFATAERSNRWLKTWQERIGSFAGNGRRRAGSARLKVEYIANARRIIQRCERRPTPNAWNHRRRKRQFPLR